MTALLLAAPALAGSRVAGTEIETSYYAISARTHAEIVRSVRMRGPRSGQAYGMGIIDFYPDYETASRDGTCRVEHATVGLRIQLRLPQWDGPADAPRSIAAAARRFGRAVRAHEMQHVRIAKRYARLMQAGLMRLKPGPSCWALRSRARELIRRLKADHLASQKAFDVRSRKQVKAML